LKEIDMSREVVVVSDNGTNFVAAEKELREAFEE